MNDWILAYDAFDPRTEGQRETWCSLGNGYFVTRGAAPESTADEVHYPGTYLAGGYNRLLTDLAGNPAEHEDLVNLPNWLALSFRIGSDDWFRLSDVKLLHFRQELDLARGVLSRSLKFTDFNGRRTALQSRCFVSMADPHLGALEVTWTPENWSGHMEIRSALDGRTLNAGVPRYRTLSGRHLAPLESNASTPDELYLKMTTTQSDLRIAQAARTRIRCADRNEAPEAHIEQAPDCVAHHFYLDATEGSSITVEKIATLFTSRDRAVTEAGVAARSAINQADSLPALLRTHEQAWQRLWQRFDFNLDLTAPPQERDPVMLHLRLHLFHLLQTYSPQTVDLDAGLPARGWHEACHGHVLWDELFVVPFLNLRLPELVAAHLRYRGRRLAAAQRVASAASLPGALYPWHSGSDGRDETPRLRFHPVSSRWMPDSRHRQQHVSLAVFYSAWQHYQATGNLQFISSEAAPMMFEIARFCAGRVTFNSKLDRYEMLGVVGPDEYHDRYPGAAEPGVNNNACLNLLTVWVLARALELWPLFPKDDASRLRDKLGLRDDELRFWDHVSRRMRLVFHGEGILSQFEGYGELAELDWPRYRPRLAERGRLDEILEAEGDSPHRYQVSRLADVLLLFYLFSAEELRQLFERIGYPFDAPMIARNVDYYLQRCTRGSALSAMVHAWVGSRTNRFNSWPEFTRGLQEALAPGPANSTAAGLHLGAMVGTVDLLQRGYLGIETRQHVLWLQPQLPRELTRLRTRLRYRQGTLAVEVTHECLKIQVVHCPLQTVRIGFGGRVMDLGENDEITLKLPAPDRASRGPETPKNPAKSPGNLAVESVNQ